MTFISKIKTAAAIYNAECDFTAARKSYAAFNQANENAEGLIEYKTQGAAVKARFLYNNMIRAAQTAKEAGSTAWLVLDVAKREIDTQNWFNG